MNRTLMHEVPEDAVRVAQVARDSSDHFDTWFVKKEYDLFRLADGNYVFRARIRMKARKYSQERVYDSFSPYSPQQAADFMADPYTEEVGAF
jgi:hypothetical protein